MNEDSCPNCDSDEYIIIAEDYNDVLITLMCQCVVCGEIFQINRFVDVDETDTLDEEDEYN